MPTLFSHALIGLTASQLCRPSFSRRDRRVFVGLSIVLPAVPDVDGVFLKLGWIPYEHFLGHRGFTHSLVAATILGALAAAWFAQTSTTARGIWVKLALYFASITATHGILDMATSGGEGIALLAPYDNTRLFFPLRPISVSPISPSLWFTRMGFDAMVSELVTIWTICFALLILATRFSLLVKAVSAGVVQMAHFVEQRYRILSAAALIAVAIAAWLLLSG